MKENYKSSLIQDKYGQCQDRNILTYTSFLDASECANAAKEYAFAKHILYGGYEDAERRVMVFLPDYLDELPEEDNPLTVLRCNIPKGSKPLTHRDYLGSILALGVDRSVVGDIIVRSEERGGTPGADIIVLKSMSEFFLSNYNQVAHSSLSISLVPVSQLSLADIHTVEKQDSVASLRLDNLISSAYNLSRTKAQEAIKCGIVFVNGLQCEKPDHMLSEGDKMVLRGKGKSVLKTIGKTTRKDRIFVTLELWK